MEQIAIMMKLNDNVATVLQTVKKCSTVTVRQDSKSVDYSVSEDIPAGHKFALMDIGAGELIRKYGEVIGVATKDIKAGQHVHIHNVESCRGRGDKQRGAGQ